MGASLLEFELKRAIGISGGSGIGATRRTKSPLAEADRTLKP
ncbi:hypothetical protein X759_19980 [Mesorhizobium sp. LSHC420B00]|nr:hypothetical protein X759_19980 [Mesorhizobium sp. LSHC420B00]